MIYIPWSDVMLTKDVVSSWNASLQMLIAEMGGEVQYEEIDRAKFYLTEDGTGLIESKVRNKKVSYKVPKDRFKINWGDNYW